jgi:hypothetical protein
MFELACKRCGGVSLRYPDSLAGDSFISCSRCNTNLFPMAELRRIAERLGGPGIGPFLLDPPVAEEG